MTVSKHFDIWEWVDFVRGMSDGARLSTMDKHLSFGCKRCERMVRVLRGFAEQAPIETRKEPPPQIIRRAEAIFPLHRPEKLVFARLMYDSFREPLPAGMRAEDRTARHALYEANDLFVDLQLEHEPASGLVTLIGQVSDREKPSVNTTTLPVLLMARKGLVASALCNRLGEFEMAYKAARDLRLYVPLRETGGHLEVQMDELAPGSTRRARSAKAAISKEKRARKPTQQ